MAVLSRSWKFYSDKLILPLAGSQRTCMSKNYLHEKGFAISSPLNSEFIRWRGSALQTGSISLIRISPAFCSVSDHSLIYSELAVPSVSVRMAQLAADALLALSTLVWSNKNRMRIDVNFCLKPELKPWYLWNSASNSCTSSSRYPHFKNIAFSLAGGHEHCQGEEQPTLGSSLNPFFKTWSSGAVIWGNVLTNLLRFAHSQSAQMQRPSSSWAPEERCCLIAGFCNSSKCSGDEDGS